MQIDARELLNQSGDLDPTTSTQVENGRKVVNLQRYVPHLLSSVNNALSRGASKLYLETYGIGIVEWRVISMLAIEPGIPALRICEVIKIDKGAASRSLSQLQRAGLVTFKERVSDPRKKNWALSAEGYGIHDSILAEALKREERLLEGIDSNDLEAFLRAMRTMSQNVEKLK